MAYSVRDLLGHFVKPRSMRQKMCPHACCRNKRVHPANMPVILPDKLLRRASDEDLAEHYRRVSHGHTAKDERAKAQVLHEMDRRDQADKARREREAERGRRREAVQSTRAAERQEREAAVENEFVRAEGVTRGNLVNAKGRARGVDPRRLFTGRESEARRYASEELLEYWQTHHRPTAASFRGKDTRVHPVATEPKRRTWTHSKTGAGYVRR
jgi:hypothetical protein